MNQSPVRYLRLYFLEAWFSYRALFAWSTPFNYVASKFGFPLFTMLLFVFMGKFAGLANPLYIVIGNILLMPSLNGLLGVSMTIDNEKRFGALTYLLGSPAPRAPVFLGRALFHILDGLFTVVVALTAALLIFHLDLSQANLLLTVGCVLLICVTTSGLGFVLGSVSLVTRDGWTIASSLALALYILVGVNFPVDLLPGALRMVAYSLPMTRGIAAARLALEGASWGAVAPLVGGEMVVGVIYITVGYWLFLFIEKRAMKYGWLEAL